MLYLDVHLFRAFSWYELLCYLLLTYVISIPFEPVNGVWAERWDELPTLCLFNLAFSLTISWYDFQYPNRQTFPQVW